MISMIVAMSSNNGIGKDNRMPWRIPSDLAYFKRVTMGHTIIMGRKTYESIGKPLPERKNIVLSRGGVDLPEQVEVTDDVAKIIRDYKESREEVIVIGGSEVYEQFMRHADRLYVTEIHEEVVADTYFPDIGPEWEERVRIKGIKTDKDSSDFTFVQYDRVNKEKIK